MTSPAVTIALILLGLFVSLALVAWFLRCQINSFVGSLLTYQSRDEHRSRSSKRAGSA